jgi:diguanylate cyclase (GGDEF)-like protein/PAS domain S-box-containing protein
MTGVRDRAGPEQLADSATELFCVLRRDGTIAEPNKEWERFLGYSPQELVSLSFINLLHPDDRERIMPGDSLSDSESLTLGVNGRVRDASGVYRVISWTILPSPELGTLYALGRNVTESEAGTVLTARIEQLHRDIDTLASMRDNLDMCLTLREAAGVISRFCREALDGWPGEVWITNASRNLLERVAFWGNADESPLETMEPNQCWAMRGGRPHTYDPTSSGMLCEHHKSLPRRSICIPLKGSNEILGLLTTWGWSENHDPNWHAYLRRVTTIAEVLAMGLANLTLRESLRSQSIRDPLTSLFNRRYMEETFDRELARAARHASTVGLIILDIDHFKHFNDEYGHRAGDTALIHLGALLSKIVRADDIACRFGGEEFAVIMPGASLQTTVQRASGIGQAVKEIAVAGEGGKVLRALSVSMGISAYPDHGATREDLILAADTALFAAKKAGRDCQCVAEPGDLQPEPPQPD